MSPELFSRYFLTGQIGEGTYGKVFFAKKLNNAMQEEPGNYALKMIKRSNNEIERPSVTSISTLREIKLLRELSHENIVNMTDVVIDTKERDVALVMEFASLTLESVLKEHRTQQVRISDYCCKAIMYQCLKGIEYLHENWTLHRDIKPSNVLIVGEGEKRGQLQLADMGLARIFKSPVRALGSVDKTVVTLWYRAPELLLGATHYTTAVDIWSLGCMFAELFFYHVPPPKAPHALFSGKPNEERNSQNSSFEMDQCRQVFSVLGIPTSAQWPDVEKLPEYNNLIELRDQEKSKYENQSSLYKRMLHYSNNTIGRAELNLLQLMLELDPKKRISAKEALQHACFDSFFKQFSPRTRQNALDDPTAAPNRKKLHYLFPKPKELDPEIQKAQVEARANLRKSVPRKRQRVK